MNAMGMDDVKVTSVVDEEGALSINMEGSNMGILIGKRGQTLDSLQYLTNRVANKMQDGYVRVKLDTEDYRRRRKETLENLAKNIASKVKRTRKTVSLEPMNPYERRIIHSALQSDPAVSTHSEGEEPYRRVVVTLVRNRNNRIIKRQGSLSGPVFFSLKCILEEIMEQLYNSTIAAISTAMSNSGIGIVRMSGPEAFQIADRVYKGKKEKKLCDQKSHTIHYGYIVDGEQVIDEVLVMLMRGPHSYTGEDTVEINCHGRCLCGKTNSRSPDQKRCTPGRARESTLSVHS